MKKTVISALLVITLLFSYCSSALMEGNTPQEKLDYGILLLETYLASGGESELVDLEMIANQFASVGSYGDARGFYQYAMLLSAVEKNNFIESKRWINYLTLNSKFAANIADEDFAALHSAIASVDVLLAYCNARELEHKGQLHEAMNIYAEQTHFYDAWNRSERISQQLNVMPGDTLTPSPKPKATATPAAQVQIISQPSVVRTAIGDMASAKITAIGSGLKYSWYVKDSGKGSFIKSSINGDTYKFEMVMTKSGRQVYCVVTDSDGRKATSDLITFVGDVRVGDRITFGAYEQDGIYANGEEEIEWIVLTKNNDQILVISQYVLDSRTYHTTKSSVSWENCSLRKWLNDDFISDAFDSAEQRRILTVQNNTDYGGTAYDRVFLLSLNEAGYYFSNNNSRCAYPTSYALAKGAFTNSNGYVWWWTRTSGQSMSHAAGVNGSGKLDSNGDPVNMNNKGTPVNGVRPAMWLDLGQ